MIMHDPRMPDWYNRPNPWIGLCFLAYAIGLAGMLTSMGVPVSEMFQMMKEQRDRRP